MRGWWLLSLALLMACSCTRHRVEHGMADGDTVRFRYARLLTVVVNGDMAEITVKNPWRGGDTGEDGEILRRIMLKTPVRNAGVYSIVHAALMRELGCLDAVGGICDVEYLTDSLILADVRSGRIVDLGSSMLPSTEQIVKLNPDVLLISPYEGQRVNDRLERLGVPVLECADYMEVLPLARAEWIRLFGILLGKREMADSIFDAVEARYNALKRKAAEAKRHPTLLAERPYQGLWNVPCAGSTTAVLYADAGARYLFDDLEGRGAKPMAIEQILDRAIGADYWLIKSFGPLTREQIDADFPALRPIKADLLVCNSSASEYFEETPFHPELLLENLVAILHPELGIRPEKCYFVLNP
ncbi:MAG: ABC transporter substrate-binding protein [Bacteroidaceae bacterium]|nr:ABC transporter substrate-binding protein [Bacteroidaceae bacterium]